MDTCKGSDQVPAPAQAGPGRFRGSLMFPRPVIQQGTQLTQFLSRQACLSHARLCLTIKALPRPLMAVVDLPSSYTFLS